HLGVEPGEEVAQIRGIGRLEQPFRPAARLEPDERRERRLGGEAAAHAGERGDHVHAASRALEMRSARLAAHLVMSPAPRQITMSPGAARWVSWRQTSSASSTAWAPRWPRCFIPSTKARWETPSIGSSPAG